MHGVIRALVLPVNEINPYVPPASDIGAGTVHAEQSAQAIGGWLILVAIGIVITPLRMLAQVLPTYVKIFTEGSWVALSTPGSATYNASLSAFIAVEMLVNGLLLMGALYLIFLFFSKRKKFPKVYILLSASTLVIQILDALIIQSILPQQDAFGQETVAEMGRTVIACAIWIPYMLTSQRVKATFVRS